MGNLLNPYRFATSGYTASATNFDGTNDYMLRGADLTGAADGKQVLISFWVKWNGGDGAIQTVFANNGYSFYMLKTTANKMKLVLENTSSTVIATLQSTSTYTAGATWYHVIASIDLATASSGYMYVNDSAEVSAYTGTNDTIDLTLANWSVGSRVAGGAEKCNACISELYYEDTYLDLSVEANRRKFIDAWGNPVDLGADGSTPTGASPLIYLPNDSTNFETNAGTGGNFTVTGALTACADSPSD